MLIVLIRSTVSSYDTHWSYCDCPSQPVKIQTVFNKAIWPAVLQTANIVETLRFRCPAIDMTSYNNLPAILFGWTMSSGWRRSFCLCSDKQLEDWARKPFGIQMCRGMLNLLVSFFQRSKLTPLFTSVILQMWIMLLAFKKIILLTVPWFCFGGKSPALAITILLAEDTPEATVSTTYRHGVSLLTVHSIYYCSFNRTTFAELTFTVQP